MNDDLVGRLRAAADWLELPPGELPTPSVQPMSASELREAAARIEALESAGRDAWVPVSERLPRPEENVIAVHQNILSNGRWGPAWVDGAPGTRVSYYKSGKDSAFRITHWMPLPPAPTGSGG